MFLCVAFALAFLATIMPVAAALALAYRQSYAAQEEKAQALAREVLRRADVKRDEMVQAFAALQKLEVPPCSPEGIRRMAMLVLYFDQYQGAGYIRGNQLLCTSMAPLPQPVDLGPPLLSTRSGYGTRTGVKLPFLPERPMNVLSVASGFALFTHPKLTTDVAIDPDREGVAVILLESGGVVGRSGQIDTALLRPYFRSGKRIYTIGDHIVAVMPSKHGPYGAVAMLPADAVYHNLFHYLLFLLPIGLLCAGILVLLLRAVVRQEKSFATIVRRALKSDQFYLHYQPKVDIRTGQWVGAEALIRWRRHSGEEMRPDLFIPLMEDAGLIQGLTDKVFALLAQDIGTDLRDRPDFHVAVNVASADLRGSRLAELIDVLVARTGCLPSQLVIEVTERGLIDTRDDRDALEAVRARGVRVAVDDFGTGYSSLSYLQKLPLDCIKIDKSFVETIGLQAPTSSVVKHIINMARDLQIGLVAEGVETEAQERFLHERGIRYAQGWKFARSMPWAQLIAELGRRAAVPQAPEAAAAG